MPLCQDVEQGQGESEPHCEIRPDAMHDLLEMAHIRQHRENGFNEHAEIAFSPLAHLEILGMPVDLVETIVGEDDHLIGHSVHDFLKSTSVVDIGCITIPVNY